MPTPPSKSFDGFTLIEMAVVVAIIGLVMAMVLGGSTAFRDGQNRQLVRTQLNTLDTALAEFVAKNKRLPCPANGLIANGALNAGIEVISPGPPPPGNPLMGECNPLSQLNGVVPWVTLGLGATDGIDPWGGRFTYRVDPFLARSAPFPALMDMSNCDPAATGPVGAGGICAAPVSPCGGSASCTSPGNFLTGKLLAVNKGLDVWDGVGGAIGWLNRQNNRPAGTGAAYVLISHGPSGTGAYNGNGTLQPGSVAAGTDETPNRNNRAVAAPAILATTYRDAPLTENATGAHFDDYLSHPTIMSVLNKANLGPRAH